MSLRSIAPGPRLRVAINTGNSALVQQTGDQLTGVSPALARRLADVLEIPMEPVVYDGAGKVFNDAGGDVWDVAFLAIDATRAEKISFTRPYHTIEATYAVRADSPLMTPDDVDSEGRTVICAKGSAYQLYLSKALRHATLNIDGAPGDSFGFFQSGQGDAVAGVRASLLRHFGDDPSIRVMDAPLTKVEQAMVLPHPNDPRIAALDAFVAEAIDSGFVANAF